jgi:hypothetical protein
MPSTDIKHLSGWIDPPANGISKNETIRPVSDMTSKRLLKISEAAELLGVPQQSLKQMADRYGMTIQMGRAIRLHPDDLEELINKCRVEQKVPASTGAYVRAIHPSGKSAMTEMSVSRPARRTAAKLKQL